LSRKRTELHEERLGTTDKRGHRVDIFPEDVKGPWRTRRNYVYWFLIIIYFTLPWIYFKGKQIIQLDIVHREFTFFGTTFYSHDAPLIFFFFIIFVFAFGFITAQWGRVWCGWACPQTVFIDAVYRKIEEMIEGKARKRRALSRAPWNFEKIWKKSLKWALYLIISLHLSHTFLGYFIGTRELFMISLNPPMEHMTAFITMLVVTGIILFDFGWFREQFCIIACPYGRMQSVMMDVNSLVVAYDVKRGEPRRNVAPDRASEGDCIDCLHCVKVCPTGIDIRRGTQQLECIACTNCIDACDEIMEKVGYPMGLIRMDSQAELDGKKRKTWRVRPFLYAGAVVLAIVGLTYGLYARNQLKVQFIRAGNTPFQEIKRAEGDSEIVNRYNVSIYYNGEKHLKLFFKPEKDFLPERMRIVTRSVPHPIEKGKKQKISLFFRFKKDVLKDGKYPIKVNILSGDNLESAKFLRQEEVRLVGPF